jgi:hypothetical protein
VAKAAAAAAPERYQQQLQQGASAEAAGEAVGRFSENVGLDFLNKHKEIMPCLLKVIKDLSISKLDMTV